MSSQPAQSRSRSLPRRFFDRVPSTKDISGDPHYLSIFLWGYPLPPSPVVDLDHNVVARVDVMIIVLIAILENDLNVVILAVVAILVTRVVVAVELDHNVVPAGRFARGVVVLEIRVNVGAGLAPVADRPVARACLAQPALLRSGLDAGGGGFVGLADRAFPRPPAQPLQELDAVGRQTCWNGEVATRAIWRPAADGVSCPPSGQCKVILDLFALVRGESARIPC